MSGPGVSLPKDQGAADPGVEVEVEAILAGLDQTGPAAHADAFEAVNDAILAELRRLEAL
ncbi:MAG: hypothetical protein ACJ75E_12890 [Actinomycetes bacterium]